VNIEEVKERKFEAILRSDNFTAISDPEGMRILAEKGYGLVEEKSILLDPIETLYLMHRGVIEVKDMNHHTLTFEALLKRLCETDKDLWLKFIVYSDLRKRGLIVKRGAMSLTFFVDKRGEKVFKRYLVACLREGSRIGFLELESFFRRSIESDRELIVAIVDKEGNVSYYTVERIVPMRGD